MDVDPAEPPAAAAAAQPPLLLEAVVVNADAVRAQESAPLASASLANTMTSLTARLQTLLGVLQHVRTCGSCSCLLCCCVTVCACFAVVESSGKPNTLEELNTCLRHLQKLDAAFTLAGVSVSPDGDLEFRCTICHGAGGVYNVSTLGDSLKNQANGHLKSIPHLAKLRAHQDYVMLVFCFVGRATSTW